MQSRGILYSVHVYVDDAAAEGISKVLLPTVESDWSSDVISSRWWKYVLRNGEKKNNVSFLNSND